MTERKNTMNEENSFIPNLTLDPVAETAAAVQEAPAEKKEEEDNA